MKAWGIVPAAGRGERAGGELPKQYAEIGGACILDHGIKTLLDCSAIEAVVVALAAADRWWGKTAASQNPRVQSCEGGGRRCDSVANALGRLNGTAADDDWIVVHDGVRPCVPGAEVERLLHKIGGEPAGGILVIPINDTVKRVDGGYVGETLPREHLVRAATPQAFRHRILREALAAARRDGFAPSDEAAAIERTGHRVKAVVCDDRCVKVTYARDVAHVEALLKAR